MPLFKSEGERKEEDIVNKWFRELHISQVWRQPYEETWDRVIDYLKTKFYDQMDDDDRVCINLVHPHVRVVIPAIYSRNPDVICEPRRRDLVDDNVIRKRAEVMRNLLRYDMKEMKLKTEVKLCILDAVLTGHAWVKTGYETEFGYDPIFEREKEGFISRYLQDIGIKEKREKKKIVGYNERVVSESVWTLRVSPYDLFVPAFTRRPEELRRRWIAERFIEPYDDIMENDDYDTDGLKPSSNAKALLAELRGCLPGDVPVGDDTKYVIRWEIWDGRTDEVICLAEGHKRFLKKPHDSEYTMFNSGYHPYLMLRFNEVNDEFYPVGDIEPAEPQIEELNDVRTKLNIHLRRYNRKYMAAPGVLDAEAKMGLKSGEDGVVIELSNTADTQDKPLESLLAPIQDAPLPPEIYAIEGRVKDDFFSITGTIDYTSMAAGNARTATEAQIRSTQSRFRVEERIDLIGEFVQAILTNIAMLRQKFSSAEDVSEIVGLDAMYWQQMNSDEDIRSEFIYNVVYGSSTPISIEVKREQFDKFYVMVKDDPMWDQIKIRLQLAREHGLDIPESWLRPDIAKALEAQMLIAVKSGMLVGNSQDAPGSVGRVPRVIGQGSGEKLPTGQPRGLAAARPSVPGGTGGTSLENGAKY